VILLCWKLTSGGLPGSENDSSYTSALFSFALHLSVGLLSGRIEWLSK
jgi:hypothetical protein